MTSAKQRKIMRDARRAFRKAEEYRFMADAFSALGRELERQTWKALKSKKASR